MHSLSLFREDSVHYIFRFSFATGIGTGMSYEIHKYLEDQHWYPNNIKIII